MPAKEQLDIFYAHRQACAQCGQPGPAHATTDYGGRPAETTCPVGAAILNAHGAEAALEAEQAALLQAADQLRNDDPARVPLLERATSIETELDRRGLAAELDAGVEEAGPSTTSQRPARRAAGHSRPVEDWHAEME
jgi:hypothetical protein